MTSSLANRLGDIPGVASVEIDLDGFGRGIDVRLEPDANEAEVMEQMRALLAAYGVRGGKEPSLNLGRSRRRPDIGIKVKITPIRGGARVEVESRLVRSFRVVAANPAAIAQGLADAWCQVIGRVPVEVVAVAVTPEGELTVRCNDGGTERVGTANVSSGWETALRDAIAGALYDSESMAATESAAS